MSQLDNILSVSDNDSFLKKSFQVVAGATIAFFGISYLSEKVKDKRKENAAEKAENSSSAGNVAAQLALQLKNAIGTSAWSNTDETVVFDIFFRKIYYRDFYQEVKQYYRIVTQGRDLESDLYNYLDPPLVKTDWEKAKKQIDLINSRKDPKKK